jgi:O-antigen ligase
MRFWHLILGLVFVNLATHVTIGVPGGIASMGRWVGLFGVASIGALLTLPYRRKQFTSPFSPLGILLLIALTFLATGLAGSNVILSVLKWGALVIQLYVLVYVCNLLLTARQWEYVTLGVTGMLVAVSVGALGLALVGRDIFGWPPLFVQGKLAAIGNPNSLGMVVLMGGVSLLWMQEHPRFQKRWHQYAIYLLLGLSVAALYLTQSRSSLAGFITGAVGWAYVSNKKMWPVALVCVVGTLLYIQQGPFVEELTRNVSENYLGGKDLTASREHIWEASWQSWKQQPLLGYGYGISGRDYEMTSLTSAVGAIRDGSGYFGVLESVGLIGTALLFVLYAKVAVHLHRLAAMKEAARNHFGWWLSGLGGTLFLALAVHATGEPWVIGPGSFPHVFFLLSLGMTAAGARFLHATTRQPA